MEHLDRADLTAARKRRFARWLRTVTPLRLLLRGVAAAKAPRQPVGAVGTVIDSAGRVLLVEHVFRTDYPWGLPGGWVERGEDPAAAVRREIMEELGLDVEVGTLLICEQIQLTDLSTHPRHLGLAFACRLVGGTGRTTPEVVSFEWVNPREIRRQLAPFQLRAVLRACGLFADAEGHVHTRQRT